MEELFRLLGSTMDLYLTFIKLLEVRQEEGSVDLPDPFKVKRMVFIRNKYTREENVFNPLRSKRPLPKLEKPERHIEELSTQTKEGCDFCRYHEYTARDSLGRVEGLHSFTAANTFKLDRWHDLVLLKKHDPINWTQEEFLDLMETLLKFEKVNQADQNYVYPSAIWDLLPHAGASQVHPHLHSFMDKERYQGFQDQWREAAMRYSGDFPKRNYFSDLIQLHAIMGLTVQYGSAVAFANIVPKKDNEMVIVSERADRDFFLLWYFVLRGFLDDMQNGTMCFSSGAAFPSMTGDTSSQSLPAYVRIITRGIVSDNRADISSLELFTTPNANTDPFHVISVMKESSSQITVPLLLASISSQDLVPFTIRERNFQMSWKTNHLILDLLLYGSLQVHKVALARRVVARDSLQATKPNLTFLKPFVRLAPDPCMRIGWKNTVSPASISRWILGWSCL
ncbi:hypothetical protein MAR_011053 [Mya arenaria]|uniref:Uncharacterized protein n=1 Tax=Mya arenaria TaxID=6604 RepID=A0ABY7FVP1_MYAAR|nr:hypothetical protein MAR_011053 [Mya arenaria]